jgi:hypothetical protein
MGEGIEVLVQAPISGAAPSVTCRRTSGDWDGPLLHTQPTASARTLEIPTDRAEEIFRRFGDARLNALPSIQTAIDCDEHSLVFLGGSNRVEYKWSLSLPPQWGELQGVVDGLTKLAEGAL